ncbi:hypothetical protein [Rhizobium sp. Leaf383]|uniref:hypothetical protein n=1 Tax=Rhizobium sp. Leaf383 TaxID=1736357 RepID=UPI0007138BEB|nr:hypothetical protein [Rhizobium sp. Leaf383]KQS84319.1 hypothetical protein ASG58_21350 [Rhizobium sp. Leaf383]
MSDTIAAAIAAAQAGAAELANTAGALAAQASTGTALGAPASAGAPLGLDDMMGGGVSVDHWLKITQFGLTIGDKTKPLDSIDVFIDMAEIAYSFQIKYQMNGKAVYHRTYDRVLDAQGGSWAETMRKAQQIDGKAYEYRSAEIPMTLATSVVSKEAGKNAAEAGERVGLTLSTTGWKQFQTWVRDLARKQIDAKNAVLKVTIGFEEKRKEGVNPWGVPTFLGAEEVDVIPHFDTVH